MTKKAWDELLQAALLGTVRAGWSAAQLPAVVLEKIPGNHTDESENLLSAIALSRSALKAGNRHFDNLPSPPARPLPEVFPSCNAAAVALWRQIREIDAAWPVLETRWLQRCAAAQQIAAPEILPEILALGEAKKPGKPALQPYIIPVIGHKGAWLAQFKPEWQYLLPLDYSRVWREGKPAERLDVLSRLRQSDGAAAISMVADTWSGESAADRKKIMQLLRINLQSGDIPVLESLFSEIQSRKGKATAAGMEIKQTIAQLLLQIPENSFRQEFITALRGYFSEKWTLPTSPDDFFFNDLLHQQMGLPANSETVNWWTDLMAIVPPGIWCEAGNTDPQTAFEQLKASILAHGGNMDRFYSNSIQAAVSTKEDLFASWLMPMATAQEKINLLPLLPDTEREQILRNEPIASPVWSSTAVHFPWSASFSQWVLETLYKSWSGFHFLFQQQLLPLDVFLHPATPLASVVSIHDNAYQRDRWLYAIVPELEKVLRVKQQLK